jgi:hypothetical protein
MFERFTDDARRVVFEARHLAVTRGDDRIGPLHMLSALTTEPSDGDSVAGRVLSGAGVTEAAVAGLLGPGHGPGHGPGAGTRPGTDSDAAALASIGIDLDEIRRKVEESFGEGALDRVPRRGAGGSLNLRGHAALTEEAKSVLALSLKEALALHHHYIGSEHLLLGLLRTAERRKSSGLQQAVTALGLSYPDVKDQVLALLATS